jgi:hypothetical protein
MVSVLSPEAVGIVVVTQDTMELTVNVSILNRYIMFGRKNAYNIHNYKQTYILNYNVITNTI